MRTGLQLVAVRSQRGPRLVADRSPTSRRPIADQSPTSFNDSHAPILTKLVGDRSATSRRLIGDWSATSPGPVCDQISRSQVFVQAQKPGCDWFGRNEVPDQSPTSLQPRRDRSGTLLRPLRSVKIVSRGEVAERLQCMSDWGLTGLTYINISYLAQYKIALLHYIMYTCIILYLLKLKINWHLWNLENRILMS